MLPQHNVYPLLRRLGLSFLTSFRLMIAQETVIRQVLTPFDVSMLPALHSTLFSSVDRGVASCRDRQNGAKKTEAEARVVVRNFFHLTFQRKHQTLRCALILP